VTADTLRLYAAEVLGLVLDAREAESVAGGLALVRAWVVETESVSLPYAEEPFTSPAQADQWLKRY
jgi:hypothetical protein